VTSWNAPGFAYQNGLRNPSGLLPVETSASLMSAMTRAEIGLEQLVPSIVPNSPSRTISRFSPIADTSGYARPDVLSFPLCVDPIEDR
jgi:hypothetical protein